MSLFNYVQNDSLVVKAIRAHVRREHGTHVLPDVRDDLKLLDELRDVVLGRIKRFGILLEQLMALLVLVYDCLRFVNLLLEF